MRHNLLTDPLFSVTLTDRRHTRLTLPGCLAELAAGRLSTFDECASHQQQSWHAFLVQLATMAIHYDDPDHRGRQPLPQDETHWLRLLRAMNPGETDSAWCLIGEAGQPAFMQPMLRAGSKKTPKERTPTQKQIEAAARREAEAQAAIAAGKKPKKAPPKKVPSTMVEWKDDLLYCPDQVDVLVLAKNHDVKDGRVISGDPQKWAFALTCLQTTASYHGVGNFGCSRINGGASSRCSIFVRVGRTAAEQFIRDVRVCLRERSRVLSDFPMMAESGGIMLGWTQTVAMAEPLSIDLFDPYYIDMARVVRLDDSHGTIRALKIGTEDTLIQVMKGGLNTDPWGVTNTKDVKMLSLQNAGFSYQLVQDILLDNNFRRGVLGLVQKDDPEHNLAIECFCIARGQGKTLGIQQRKIPVPRDVKTLLDDTAARKTLAEIARERVGFLSQTETALRYALKAFAQGKIEDINHDAKGITQAVARYSQEFADIVDRDYFVDLWAEAGASDEERPALREIWKQRMFALAQRVLNDAAHSTPIHSGKFYASVAAGEIVLFRMVSRLMDPTQRPGPSGKPARKKLKVISMEVQS